MHKLTAFVTLLAAAIISPLASAKVTEAEKSANAEAMERGRLLYRYDQAAWHSTDALMAAIRVDDYPDLRGWVVEPHAGDTLLVTYFAQRKGPRYAVLRYVVRGSTVIEGGLVPKGADTNLSPLANRLVDARDAAAARFAKERLGLCTEANPNTIVLPPDEHDRIQAYIMSASKTAGVFPLGGHYRFTIGPDGKVESWRPFLKSCMIIDTRPEGEMQQKTAFFVSHVLDSQPTEIHYFARYNVPVDIAVMTTDGDIWMLGVDGFTNPKDSEIKLP